MIKTRYLQISDIIMFEYNMLGESDVCSGENPSQFLYTKLMDGHNLLMSPVSYECEEFIDSSDITQYKKLRNPLSLNSFNHLAIPKDKESSLLYYFVDNDYSFIDSSIMNNPDISNVKYFEYSKYLRSPLQDIDIVKYYDSITDVRWDSMKLYFVNGYDFSNIYGFYVKVYVDKNTTTSNNSDYVDLCDFFITKENYFKLINYLSTPIIFGNNIYDRYIELNLPSIYDLVNNQGQNLSELFDILDIKHGSTLKLNFAYVLSDDKEIETLSYDIEDLGYGDVINDKVNCTFTKSSNIKGTIPTENINSDNLGCYVAEAQGLPYIEFYGTWKDIPLNSETVWKFNKGIRLYDNSLVQRDSDYEVSDEYEVQYDLRKWVAMHELKLSFCVADQVVKEETYNMSQIFLTADDQTKFYYRPIIFDENTGLFIDNIQVVYTMRFINVNDKVQFVKVATLSIVCDTQKYYAKGTSLKMSNMNKYFVYNKIIENKQNIVNTGSGVQSTKYVKFFYDTTNVVLDDNGTQYGMYNYTLNCSRSPKSYKFIFKKTYDNGSYDYMDLTSGYYKLLFKDATGSDIVIEPTYSGNMNLYLGELEFNFSSNTINKMMALSEKDRKMSIVVYNDDSSVSSMFDFNFSI